MSAPHSYTRTATVLQKQGIHNVYRAVRDFDRHPVILKVLDPRRSRPRHLEQLKHEYEIGRLLDTPAAVRPIAFETYEGMPALVLEDFGGDSLADLLGTPMPVERFLPLAIGIVRAVAEIHQRGVIHKDLKPRNILIKRATGEVKIADFALASCLAREPHLAKPPQLIEGSLPYLSPEQTGRTNRAVDSRADLYALGVTFYEMLTGRLPFDAHDPVEWVHCHVARAPSSPTEIVPDVPAVVASVVLKLLSKMPEDRYQTARGLRVDLEQCLVGWNAAGRIENFQLGERDAADRLRIPQKLYGRQAETELLLAAFGRVIATGTPELLLVSGSPGIGKSSLVRELQRPIVRERAFFLSGKFEQYKQDIPYSTLVQAFRELVLEILAENEERVAAWRDRLVSAIGSNGQLIVDVIPPIELIIGRQAPVPELPAPEAQNRFRAVLRDFIGVFARKEHTLTLFLDDLQWADWASLSLLADLLAHPDTRHLFIIGAYRDNEVTAGHRLQLTIDEVRRSGVRVSSIVLGPIAHRDLAVWVGEALHRDPDDAAPLAELIYEKTAGNPFFAIQFLASLHQEGLIAFDEPAMQFRWDMASIRDRSFKGDVVGLMAEHLRRLPSATCDALKQLACVGDRAPVSLLTMILGGADDQTHRVFWDAVRAGLVLRLDEVYQFLHDRVQEAAYSLIPESERAAIHLRIGRLLASRIPQSELEEKIFDVVNQLDRGAPLITSQEEKERVAELDLTAGRRARSATAYASALTYFIAGSELLSHPATWDRRYDLTFGLELGRAECEYLTGNAEQAERRLFALSGRTRNLVDNAAVTSLRLALYTTLDQNDRGVEVGLEYLRRIGVDWSPHPSDEQVRDEYTRMWAELGDRPIEDLARLPSMTSAENAATMDVLTSLRAPAFYTDQNLFHLLVGRMVHLSLLCGNTDASCLAYVWLGTILGPSFGNYQAGYRFGKVALDLVENLARPRYKAWVYLSFGHLVIPWTQHMRNGLDLIRRAFTVAEQTGDLQYASYAANRTVAHLLALGEPLAEVHDDAERALEVARRARFGFIITGVVTGQLRLIRSLRGLLPSLASFNDAQFDEGAFERHLGSAPQFEMALCWYWIRKLEARFYAADYQGALEASKKAARLFWMWPMFSEAPEYRFYTALALAAHHHDVASPDERSQHIAELTAHKVRLDAWAATCPENFANRAALVGAEIARIEGRDLDAERLYEDAIRSAREGGFVQNEAIAYETAARFYRKAGYDLFADAYLREARSRYLRWGAEGKVRQLDQFFPQLVPRKPLSFVATLALQPDQLDLLSVTKASQTISGEIELDKLVKTLLQVVLEQSGAQRAYLVLNRDRASPIVAEATIGGRMMVIETASPIPADPAPRIPASLVHYVERTREPVILNDAALEPGRFAGDPYFARRPTKSVLGMPIVRQGSCTGILYLENDLLAGAFTPDRLAALELLATQAAISLENARLLASERAARSAAEDAERRAAFLAGAGELLSGKLDDREMLARLGRLCVRWVCDWCMIDVVEGDEIHPFARAHRDPSKEFMLQELQRRYPPHRGSPHPSIRVLESGRSLLQRRLPDRSMCVNDEHLKLLCEIGTVSGVSVPLKARGQAIGALTLVSSTSERIYGPDDLELAEEVARRTAITIDNARLYRAAQEAIRARSEFLSVASHELNTPMTSLMLAVQSIRRAAPSGRPIDPRVLEQRLDIVSRQAARLTMLIRDLLDVSRIQAGPLLLELAPVELDAIVRDVVERFEPDLVRSKCSVSISGTGPIVGRWDRSRLDQVVTNLLSNAIKFGAGKPIEISLRGENGLAQLAVKDHGIGIPSSLRGRLFEPFERGVSDRQYGGLGLGLYITRSIVESHGGTIGCESRPGAGSTFVVELPLVRGQRLGQLPAASLGRRRMNTFEPPPPKRLP